MVRESAFSQVPSDFLMYNDTSTSLMVAPSWWSWYWGKTCSGLPSPSMSAISHPDAGSSGPWEGWIWLYSSHSPAICHPVCRALATILGLNDSRPTSEICSCGIFLTVPQAVAIITTMVMNDSFWMYLIFVCVCALHNKLLLWKVKSFRKIT